MKSTKSISAISIRFSSRVAPRRRPRSTSAARCARGRQIWWPEFMVIAAWRRTVGSFTFLPTTVSVLCSSAIASETQHSALVVTTSSMPRPDKMQSGLCSQPGNLTVSIIWLIDWCAGASCSCDRACRQSTDSGTGSDSSWTPISVPAGIDGMCTRSKSFASTQSHIRCWYGYHARTWVTSLTRPIEG